LSSSFSLLAQLCNDVIYTRTGFGWIGRI